MVASLTVGARVEDDRMGSVFNMFGAGKNIQAEISKSLTFRPQVKVEIDFNVISISVIIKN